MKRWFCLSLIMFFLTSVSAIASDMKIGYVDLQKALNFSAAGKAAKLKISEKVKEYEGVIEKRQEDLKLLKEELEKKALLLSESARSEKERDYQQKLKELQRFTKDVEEELQQKDADMTKDILEDLFEVIKEIGESEDLTLVLEKTESSILYASPAIDMTDRVIKAYDQKAKGKSAK